MEEPSEPRCRVLAGPVGRWPVLPADSGTCASCPPRGEEAWACLRGGLPSALQPCPVNPSRSGYGLRGAEGMLDRDLWLEPG